MLIDDVAEAIYKSRPRRLKWEELSERGWKVEYYKIAQAALDVLDLTPEFKHGEDGYGGQYHTTDSVGRTISSTVVHRSPTEFRRYVTGWEVLTEPQEHSSTVRHDPPITYTSSQ